MGSKEFSWDGIAGFFKNPFGLFGKKKTKKEVGA
jgi:hypothetical protein